MFVDQERYPFKRSWRWHLIRWVDVILDGISGRIHSQTFPQAVRSILIIRLDHIGDLICSLPALPVLKHRFPRAKITALVGEEGKAILDRNPFIDRIIVFRSNWFSRKKGMFLIDFFRTLRELKKTKYDLGFDLRGDLRNIVLMTLAGVRYRVGYGIAGGSGLLHQSPVYDPTLHQVELNLNLVSGEAISKKSVKPEIYLTFDEKEEALKKLKEHGFKKEFELIAIHPEAGYPSKEWEAEKFETLAQKLLADSQDQILILGLSERARKIAHRLKETGKNRIIDLVGVLNLRQMIAVLSHCRLFIGNDSGPSHIAQALGIPVVVIASGTNEYEKWGLWTESAQVLRHEVPCSPCDLCVCNVEGHPCMSQISTDSVYESIRKLIPKFILLFFVFLLGSHTAARGEEQTSFPRVAPHISQINPNGSFGSLFEKIGTGFDGWPEHILVQQDGKIVIAGKFSSFNGQSLNPDWSTELVRLNPDGSFDSSFQGRPQFSRSTDRFYSLVAAPNGNFFVTGYFSSIQGYKANGIAKLDSNGAVDPTFLRNTRAIELFPGYGQGWHVRTLAVEKSGKILLGGDFYRQGESYIELMRLNRNGTLDRSFSADRELPSFFPSGNDFRIALQSDGKILVAGTVSVEMSALGSEARIYRLKPDGSLDSSFRTVVLNGGARTILDLALQPDGKIIVAGSFQETGLYQNLGNLARFNPDGLPDAAFMENIGIGCDNQIRSVLLQGKQIVAGGDFRSCQGNSAGDIARFLPNGQLDKEFLVQNAGGYQGGVSELALLPNRNIAVVGGFESVAEIKKAFPAWNECSVNSDCAAVPDICGTWSVSSLRFAYDVEVYFKRHRGVIDCVYRQEPKPEVMCRENLCVAK